MTYNGSVYYSGFSGVTPQMVGGQMGKTLSSGDIAFLTLAIEAIELSIAKACNRNFKVQTYHELLDTGRYVFPVKNTPINEVKKMILEGVTKYDSTSGANTWVLGRDFFVYESSIDFNLPIHNYPHNQALRIEYSILPFWGSDVKMAISQYAQDFLQKKEYAGQEVKKFSFTSLSVEFAENKNHIPPYVMQVIENYRKILI